MKGRKYYTNERFGRAERGVPPGDYTLDASLPVAVEIIRPRYTEGPLVFRPWPQKDFDHPNENLQPGRNSASAYGQTQWILRVTAAAYVGIREGGQPATFLLYEPWADPDTKRLNPYRIFYRAASSAYKAGVFANGRNWHPSWNRLFLRSDGNREQISKPTGIWFVQGHVFANGDTEYVGDEADRALPLGLEPEDPLPIIQLSESAGENLVHLLDTRKDHYEGDEEADPHLPFKYGSVVGLYDKATKTLRGGLFVSIYNPRKTRITAHTSWAGEYREVQPYEAALSNKYEAQFKGRKLVFQPSMTAAQVAQVFAKGQFWLPGEDPKDRGLLRFAPYEEQALWIARAFAPVAELVRLAFLDHPEYLTEEVKAVLNRRVTSVPGAEEDEEGEADDEDALPTPPLRKRSSVDKALQTGLRPAAAPTPPARKSKTPRLEEDVLEDQGVLDDAMEADQDEFSDDMAADLEQDDLLDDEAEQEQEVNGAAAGEDDAGGEEESMGELGPQDLDEAFDLPPPPARPTKPAPRQRKKK